MQRFCDTKFPIIPARSDKIPVKISIMRHAYQWIGYPSAIITSSDEIAFTITLVSLIFVIIDRKKKIDYTDSFVFNYWNTISRFVSLGGILMLNKDLYPDSLAITSNNNISLEYSCGSNYQDRKSLCENYVSFVNDAVIKPQIPCLCFKSRPIDRLSLRRRDC